ncbi:ATP-binding cassette domain-containing protein [Bifidobacterium imperatoris]|uniref:ATP-binding cassette domain-containing protein n=1 Tax=Bifidobacterium imperatoris TaxID=2020965 RepID=A0A2N5IU88_9BIFI|nr:energy-coupling factor transporter ATPase [Bifidobacterium imperatoris]PLS25520.1 cobalt ABC transporter [Bifidobacterium imperatoris]QSY57092.1 ATP-binding cassette domain-containing protein [Bifidobacterium imperatoris]
MNSSDAQMSAAELNHIRFSYDHGSTWALDDVSLTVYAGERLCLVGPNGSGKSTLARLIAGLTAPDAGAITLLGHTVYTSEAGPNAEEYRAARRGIGMVFQNPEDQIVTTVIEDDVAFGPENLGIPRTRIGERINASLEAVGLASHRDSDPTRMSGGQQQRATIAGMLAMNPAILVLDEPTAMLDETARAEVMNVLDALHARGTTIVHVTHHPQEAAHADRVVHMEHGRITEIAAQPQVQSNHANSCPDPAVAQELHAQENSTATTTAGSDSLPLLGSDADAARNDTAHNAASAPAIRVEHLSFRYGSGRTVIDNLSFAIPRGETVAVMGTNGSGKSTLAKLLCALGKPSAGSIEVAGVPLSLERGGKRKPRSANRKQLMQLRKRVGYVMQHPEHQLFADTVAEDIAYGPRNQGLTESEVQGRVHQALDMLRIAHLANRSPFDLSGGQQRLVAIAGVVACQPEVLIMDEPTASLDVHAKARIHELIRTLQRQGVTIFIITHDRAEAFALAQRVVRMPDAHETAVEEPPQGAGTSREINDASAGTAVPASPAATKAHQNRSFVQQLDPRVKMVGFLAAMFTMFAVSTPAQLALGIAVNLALIAAARINPVRLLSVIHPILALLALMSLANLIVVRTGTVLASFGPLLITSDGVLIAVLYACRFALVIILGAVFLNTTTPTAMTDAFEALLKPLSRVGVHTQEIALVMSLALRFIPTLTGETKSIVDAQAARGGSVETGSPMQRIKAMSAIIVPVFAGTLRHADNLSLALDARCYEEGIQRTHWRVFSPGWRDAIFAAVIIAYITAIIVL